MENIEEILIRYREGKCNAEERALIESLYARLNEPDRINLPEKELLKAERQMKKVVFRKINNSHSVSWIKIAAMITLVFVIGGVAALYLYGLHSQKDKAVSSYLVRGNLLPGGNKAILTLSDGNHIILDSNTAAKVAKQSGAVISSNSGGKITYIPDTAHQNANVVYNTVTTPNGGQWAVELSDGTKVWLNAESSITYPVVFRGKERSVTITGEAYFEVKHNAAMPFSVHTGHQIIYDIGTSFDVNAYSDENKEVTTLISGSINIHIPDKTKNNKDGTKSIALNPGQQIELSGSEKPDYRINDNIAAKDVISWKEGIFRFNKIDISAIMRQIARWYNVKVEYRGRISGTLSGSISRNVNARQILDIIQMTNKVSFQIEDNKIIVQPVKSNIMERKE